MLHFLKNVFLLFFISNIFAESDCASKKVLICGVGRDIEYAIDNLVANTEELGCHFKDYQVILYENNSTDLSAEKLKNWEQHNSHVKIVSCTLDANDFELSRTERIAKARNIVLDYARHPEYRDFDYLIMVDLDFVTSWPIIEILKTMQTEGDWDCVTANGIRPNQYYRDRYAFRNKKFPLGPELLGDDWWGELHETWFSIEGVEWSAAFSAFGGLAIYKYLSIINFSYSGIVTKDLCLFYEKLLRELPSSNKQKQQYVSLNRLKRKKIPIVFRKNTLVECPVNYPFITVCEHVTLHASMWLHGFNKIYVNPKLIMRYQD